MAQHSNYLRLSAFVTLSLVAACGGGDEPAPAEDIAAAGDTAITSVSVDPLSDEELSGFEREDLAMQLPWMARRVSRDPEPLAPRASVADIDVIGQEAFDRVIFRFTDATPFPGYRVAFAPSDTTFVCGEDESTLGVSGERALIVSISPARKGEGATLPVRVRRVGQARFADAGVVCEDDNKVVWTAGLSEGAEVRTLQLRSPNRLVVDIR